MESRSVLKFSMMHSKVFHMKLIVLRGLSLVHSVNINDYMKKAHVNFSNLQTTEYVNPDQQLKGKKQKHANIVFNI